MWNTLQANGSNGLPHVLQPGYSVMNLRFGLNQTDAHWMSELYITNLLNKDAVIYTNEGSFGKVPPHSAWLSGSRIRV
jgi:hypothetical protein